jgi:hypothetical protein
LYPEKRPAIEEDSKPTVGKSYPPELGKQVPPCNKCGRMHVGECRMTGPTCFKCGKFGHFRKHCPTNRIGELRSQGGGYQQQKPA